MLAGLARNTNNIGRITGSFANAGLAHQAHAAHTRAVVNVVVTFRFIKIDCWQHFTLLVVVFAQWAAEVLG
jgi:hypothetical protein